MCRKGQPPAFHRDHRCSYPAPITLPPDSQVFVSARHLLHRYMGVLYSGSMGSRNWGRFPQDLFFAKKWFQIGVILSFSGV